MRKDSQRLFDCIQFLGSITVLYIQFTVIVIMNEIQTVAGALLARWVYMVNPECCCLNINSYYEIWLFYSVKSYIYTYFQKYVNPGLLRNKK